MTDSGSFGVVLCNVLAEGFVTKDGEKPAVGDAAKGLRTFTSESKNVSVTGVDLLLTLLSSSTKTKYKMESGLFLDVVIGKSTSVLKLLSSKDETLLIRWDSLLVLDLGLYVVNCV